MSAAKIVLEREIERCQGIRENARKNGDSENVSLYLVIEEYKLILKEILELEIAQNE